MVSVLKIVGESLDWLRRWWMTIITLGAWDDFGWVMGKIIETARGSDERIEHDLRQRINVLDYRLTELMRVIEQSGVTLRSDLMEPLPPDEMPEEGEPDEPRQEPQARVVEVPRPPGSAQPP